MVVKATAMVCNEMFDYFVAVGCEEFCAKN
jgi:hypothetical protein